MKVIKEKNFVLKNTCVTIGKFDGVHMGHRRILRKMNRIKEEQGLKTVVLTFDYSYFSTDKEERLDSYDEKIKLLEASGVDIMIDYPFDDDTRTQSAEDFIKKVLVEKLGAKAVIVGDNFKFGYKASGDTEMLKKYGNELGFKTIVIPCVEYRGSAVSSTRIREELMSGHEEEALEMLCRKGGS